MFKQVCNEKYNDNEKKNNNFLLFNCICSKLSIQKTELDWNDKKDSNLAKEKLTCTNCVCFYGHEKKIRIISEILPPFPSALFQVDGTTWKYPFEVTNKLKVKNFLNLQCFAI